MHAQIFAIALLLLFVSPIKASGETDAIRCNQIFNGVFSDSNIYRPGRCAENVLNLLRVLQQGDSGFDIKQARVIYFLPKGVPLLQVMSSRSGPHAWRFHVVVEYNGKILDLDNASKSPELTIGEYVRNMFLFPDDQSRWIYRLVGITDSSERALFESIATRAIPAEEYFRDYKGGSKDYTFYSDPQIRAYPLLPLSKFAGKLESIPAPKKETSSPIQLTDLEILKAGNPLYVDPAGSGNHSILWNAWDLEFEFNALTTEISVKDTNGRDVIAPERIRTFLHRIALERSRRPEIDALLRFVTQ